MSKKICLGCGHYTQDHYVYAAGDRACEKICKRCLERAAEVKNLKRVGKSQQGIF